MSNSRLLKTLAASLVLLIFSASVSMVGQSYSAEELALREEAEAAAAKRVWNKDSVLRAQTLLISASKHWRLAANSSRSSACLREAAELHFRLNTPALAIPLLKEALKAQSDTASEVLATLALAEIKLGDLPSARQYSDRSVRAAETSGSVAAAAYASYVAAELAYFSRDNKNMIALLDRSVELYQKSGDPLGEADALTNLAYGYVMSGDRLRGSNIAERAAAIARGGGDTRRLAFALIALGDANERMGDWNRAFEVFKEAESYFPEGLDHFEKAILFDRFGVYFETYDDIENALDYYRRAYLLFESLGDRSGTSQLLTVSGQMLARLGKHDEALENMRKGLAVSQTPKDPYTFAFASESIGDLYKERGDLTLAKQHYTTALEHFRQVGIRHSIASAHQKLGETFWLSGEMEKAREQLESALAINRQIMSRIAEAENLYSLALIDRAEGKRLSAEAQVSEAIRLTEYIQAESADPRMKRSHFARHAKRYEFLIDLLLDRPDRSIELETVRKALFAAEQLKARTLTDNLLRSDASLYADAPAELLESDRKVRIALNAKSDKLTDLLDRSPESAEIPIFESEIKKLQAEADAIRAEIRRKSPLFSAFKDQPPFDVADFQSNSLDPNAVLLEFFLGTESSYLWLVTNTELKVFTLPAKDEIGAKVGALRSMLDARRPQGDESIEHRLQRISDADAKYVAAARELSNTLLGPVADKIIGKRLIVVPDGKLNYFPLSALPMPNSSSDDPLLLTNEVIYQPSAQTYALMQTIGREPSSRNKDLLVFSDPVFNSSDERLTGIAVAQTQPDEPYRFRLVESFSSLSRLLASKTEAETVAGTVGESDLFTGFDATRERLLSTDLADYKVVHLATHGFLDPERPELSSLVLSRYDQLGKPIDEAIRMHDIYSMKLNADLVVLSACETGTGKEIKGEGVMGLNTAFLQAGARSVVSTLWQVEDNAANELMKEFYGRMVSDGMSPSAALRAAQIKLYNDPQFRSPFFWAAFTVHGDAAAASPFKKESSRFAIGIAAAVLLALVVVVFGRRYRTSNV